MPCTLICKNWYFTHFDHAHIWMFCVSAFFFWTSAWCTVHVPWTVHQGIWTMFLSVNSNRKLFFLLFSVFSRINGIQTFGLDGWPIGLDFGPLCILRWMAHWFRFWSSSLYRILGANKIKEAWKILKRQFGVWQNNLH